MGLTVAVVALALTDRGMDLFQVALLFGVYSVTTMTMELPFGGLADKIGRKPVFLTAVVSSALSLALFLSSSDFYVLAISFAFIGFGRAPRSGTLDAWFFETFKLEAPAVDVQPALARAQWANAMGLAIGALLGGALPDALGSMVQGRVASVYDVSYLVSFAVTIGVFVYTMVFIVEARRPLNPWALKASFASVPAVIADAALLAFRQPTLSALLVALALFLMATNPVEVIWPTHVKPMLADGLANTSIGALTALYFFSIAFGAWLSPHVSRFLRRQHAVTLSLTFAILAAIQIVLALQDALIGFALAFAFFAVALGVSETPASSLLHACVEDYQRSTMLSLRSLIQQVGAALGLILAGAIADAYSTPAAWLACVLFLAAAAGLTAALAKRLRD